MIINLEVEFLFSVSVFKFCMKGYLFQVLATWCWHVNCHAPFHAKCAESSGLNLASYLPGIMKSVL